MVGWCSKWKEIRVHRGLCKLVGHGCALFVNLLFKKSQDDVLWRCPRMPGVALLVRNLACYERKILNRLQTNHTA